MPAGDSPDRLGSPPRPTGARPSAAKAFLAGAVGGLVIVVLAGVGAGVAWPTIAPILLGDQEARLSTLERGLSDLSGKLAAIEREQGRTAGGEASAGLGPLNQRVTALESAAHGSGTADPRLAALPDQTDKLSADVDRLREQLDSLRRAMPPEGTILRLAERAEAAEKEVRQVAAQRASAQALLLVVGQLRDAIDRGDPYQSELRAARRVATAEDAQLLEPLAAGAATGIARKAALVEGFPTLASDIVRSAYAPVEGDLWQRAVNRLTRLISIRRIDGQGDGPAAIVARAETRARAGELAKAADELSALKGAPAEVAAKWIDQAKARADADRVLSELAASAAAQTAKND
jgi:hypothetical protein